MGVLTEIDAVEENITKCKKKIQSVEKSMKLKLRHDQLEKLSLELEGLKKTLKKQEEKLSLLRRENRHIGTTSFLVLLLTLCLFYFSAMLLMQWGLPSNT